VLFATVSARQPADEPKAPPAQAELPTKGMTAAAVRDKYGAPKRLARQIFYRRHLEVWTYDPPHNFQVEFDCPRGEDPTVLSVRVQGAPADGKVAPW
jgi:hypothetical protein